MGYIPHRNSVIYAGDSRTKAYVQRYELAKPPFALNTGHYGEDAGGTIATSARASSNAVMATSCVAAMYACAPRVGKLRVKGGRTGGPELHRRVSLPPPHA
jgi:hypothetical protein